MTASHLTYSSDWVVSPLDYFASKGATNHSDNVTFGGSGTDQSSLTITITNSTSDNFFRAPVDQFGTSFSFDVSETGATGGGPSDLIVTAQDDTVQLADIRFAPGAATSVTVVSSQSGVTLTPTPEPSPAAILGAGVFELGVLYARRRHFASRI